MASKTVEKIRWHRKVIRGFLAWWNRIVFRPGRVYGQNCQCRDDRNVR
jgi:hypothetical protein